jgi:hypothetical protein
MSLEKEFRSEVRKHLEPLAKELTPLLSQLIAYEYPKEVEALIFEVFYSGFTSGFPVRVFFIDGEDSEFFVYENGEAQYPSPIDPGLLKIEKVFSKELEQQFTSRDEQLDTFTEASLELIDWFSKCWREAGGSEFSRVALIMIHDDTQVYDLKTGVWMGE